MYFYLIFAGLEERCEIQFICNPQLLTGVNAIDIDPRRILCVDGQGGFRKPSSGVTVSL